MITLLTAVVSDKCEFLVYRSGTYLIWLPQQDQEIISYLISVLFLFLTGWPLFNLMQKNLQFRCFKSDRHEI